MDILGDVYENENDLCNNYPDDITNNGNDVIFYWKRDDKKFEIIIKENLDLSINYYVNNNLIIFGNNISVIDCVNYIKAYLKSINNIINE